MDIIPITPAPQPELTTHDTKSPGTDDTGFNAILKDVSATQDNNQATDNSDDPSTSSHEKSYLEQETVPAEDSQTRNEEGSYNAVYVTTVTLKASLEIPTGSQQPETAETIASLPKEAATQNFQNLTESVSQVRARTISYVALTSESQKDIEFSGNSNNRNQNSILLGEIQKLINQNGDKVTMTGHFSNTANSRELPGYMSSPLLSQISPDGQSTISLSTSGASVAVQDVLVQGNTETQQPALRQDTTEQFMNAKIASIETKNENNNSDKDTLKQNNNSDQQQASSQPSTKASASSVNHFETIATNQTLSSHFQSSSLTVTSESVPSANLQHSAQSHLLYENQVVNQIVNRFSIHTRLQSGRMTLQLHPAELGELKIDIEMKGDSLKANIVAHTQQAQEIIEKNLIRLRGILEDQGMLVEDLIVTFQSDSVDDFSQQQSNPFQDQMNGFSNTVKNNNPPSFEQSIEDVPVEEGPSSNSVNLTI